MDVNIALLLGADDLARTDIPLESVVWLDDTSAHDEVSVDGDRVGDFGCRRVLFCGGGFGPGGEGR